MKVILRIFKLSKETVADLLDFRTRRYSATFSFFVKTERGGFTIVDYFAGYILNPNKIRPTNVYDIIGRGSLIIKEGNLMNPCIETYYEQDFKSEENAITYYRLRYGKVGRFFKEIDVPGKFQLVKYTKRTELVWLQ